MFKENDRIGQYKLVRRLGIGGFGEVWLAKKRSLFITKHVAIKLPLDHQIDLDAIGKEASLWEQASGHPNVLPIIDADIYEGQVAIVSEYVDGGSLDDKLRQEGKLSLKTCVQMTIGILKGLEYLHDKGIIHRDLKPQNILLQGDTPRIADFGISRAVVSSTQNVAGTPSYMAPEAFDGDRNVQTDIWSVGVIIYRMLFGELPFPQKDMPSLIKAIIFDELKDYPINIPLSLRMIISKMLAKNQNNRYHSVSEILEDFQSPMFDFDMMIRRHENQKKINKLVKVAVDRNEKPRIQHYFFAHKYLREVMNRSPRMFVENFLKPSRLSFEWVHCARLCKPEDEEFIPADGLLSYPVRFAEDHYGVIIQMPQPKRIVEAYFIAVILKEEKETEEETSYVNCRYLTLEVGVEKDGSPITINGEWLPVGEQHINRGNGPEPSQELFIQEVHKIVGDGTGIIKW
jgi:serine/threonine protein kinase